MADSLRPEKRSWNMSRIKGKDTSIEIQVRKYLFSQGFRYKKNVKNLPGKPDIVLPKYHAVVFVHGCFWHRHDGCKYAYTHKTRVEFWQTKFDKNVQNDLIIKLNYLANELNQSEEKNKQILKQNEKFKNSIFNIDGIIEANSADGNTIPLLMEVRKDSVIIQKTKENKEEVKESEKK